MTNHTLAESFRCAAQGIITALKTERNMRIHFVAAVLVTLVGLIVHLTKQEWLIIIAAITFVLVSELINTAIEAAVDLVVDEYHPSAKIAKDAAAGAVLMSAVMAVIIGAIVFYPHLKELVR